MNNLGNFIEVKQGILVNTDSIEAIISISDPKKPDTMCMIYTMNNKYPSVLPKEVVLQMISKTDNSDKSDTQEQILNIMKEQTNVMGG